MRLTNYTYIVTGGRGTGKTSWLNIISRLDKSLLCFDLDKEIETRAGKTVAEIFREEGEKGFRLRERKTFSEILSRLRCSAPARSPMQKIFIAVGAGFRFRKRPGIRVIHLRRLSDGGGRILRDRPRLKPRLSLYEENRALHAEREPFYRKQADEVLTRREHWKEAHLSDKLFLGTAKQEKPLFSLTLNRSSLPSDPGFRAEFLRKRQQWGVRFFELKDPSPSFAAQVREHVPDEKLLFTSYRTDSCKKIKNKIHWCWDLRLGPPPKEATVLSLHERRGGAVSDLFRRLLKYKVKYKGVHLKAAPLVSDLRELQEGFRFQQEDWGNVSFLPRSKEGRWGWYRLSFGGRLKLHFIKEGAPATVPSAVPAPALASPALEFPALEFPAVPDQPFFAEAVHYQGRFRKGLAGVLGDPVDLSATPWEQDRFFFQKSGIPVFPVPLKKEEMTEETLRILKNFGFVFFAVTSPLKRKAFQVLLKSGGGALSRDARRLQSLNTLILHKGTLNKGTLHRRVLQKARYRGFNTDSAGLALLKKIRRPDSAAGARLVADRLARSGFARSGLAGSRLSAGRTAVWGGGGVLSPLKRLLPGASFYSARTGRRRFGPSLSGQSPDTVIWAVPRARMQEGARFPPKSWNPALVQDLNYTEDSPGLEYSAQTGAVYQSGWNIFKKQAARQRALFARLQKGRP